MNLLPDYFILIVGWKPEELNAEAALEHYPAAVGEYEVALKLAPKDSSLRFALADACLQAGQTDRAKRELKALLAADSDYPGAQLLLEGLEDTPAEAQKK